MAQSETIQVADNHRRGGGDWNRDRDRDRDRKPTGEEVGLFIFGLTAAAILAARNYLASLMRQTWDSKASSLGLLPYQLSSGRTAWFVPTGLVANGERYSTHASTHVGKHSGQLRRVITPCGGATGPRQYAQHEHLHAPA